MRLIGFRALLVVLALALLVPARLHALVATQASDRHDVTLSEAHHHDHGGHQTPDPSHEHDRQTSHAQCLAACLVIPVPQAIFQAPPDVFRRVAALAATPWAKSLAPPPLERPPRTFS